MANSKKPLELPRPEGLQGYSLAPREQRLPGTVLQPTSLVSLSREHGFMHPGLLYAAAAGEVNPILDWVQQQPHDVVLPLLTFEYPTALGLGEIAGVNWEHSLLVVPLEHWESLHQFLLSTGYWARGSREKGDFFWKAGARQFFIPDWLQLSRRSLVHTAPDRVAVTYFELFGNQGSYQFEQTASLLSVPRVVGRTQDAEVQRFHQALLQEAERPFEAVEGPLQKGNDAD